MFGPKNVMVPSLHQPPELQGMFLGRGLTDDHHDESRGACPRSVSFWNDLATIHTVLPRLPDEVTELIVI